MTTEEAIWAMNFYKAKLYNGIFNQYIDAFDMAIAALRAQQVAEKNGPLTIAELREMDGQPVYIHSDIFPDDCRWRVAQRIDVLRVYFTDGGSLSLTDYDKSWLAYRRKPEDGNE